jgi:translation initiation factor IF-2
LFEFVKEYMAKRLIKVAKDLNVGINTLVEHLQKQGIEVENSPRTQVSDEAYDILVRDFQKSIAIKSQADQLTIGTRIKETEKKEEQEKERKRREEEARIRKEEEARKKREEEERVQRELDRLRKEEAENARRIKEEKEAAERKKQADEAAKKKLTVVGKIDLDQVNKKNRPKKEGEPQRQDKPKEERKPQNQGKPQGKRQDKPKTSQKNVDAILASTPNKVEMPTPPVITVEDSTTPEIMIETPQKELIKAEAPQLIGLKIKGKINLDQFKKPAKKRRKTKEEEAKERAAAKASNTDKVVGSKEVVDKKTGTVDSAANEKRRRKRRRKKVVKPPTLEATDKSPATTGDKKEGDKKEGDKKPATTGTAKPGDVRPPRRRQDRPKRQIIPSTTSTTNTTSSTSSSPTGTSNRRRGIIKREEPKEVSQKEIQDKIKATMARIAGGGKSKRQRVRRSNRDQKRDQQEKKDEQESNEVIQVTEFISVSEFASLLDIGATDIIMTCMNAGIIVSINQRLDAEVIELIADEYGHEIEFISAEEQIDLDDDDDFVDDPADLEPRGAIVTVMGHVDHGKTSLLDHIRKANVADGEAGGITQHIGAYEVKVGDKKVTFLDTPGHEAFTAMRARGAKVTDVAVIIISADDSVMPQTKEAISHAQAAGVPIVFAINKIDKPGANPERIKEQLASMNLLVEDWGGKYQSQDISAKKGTGIDELVEKIQLEAEILDLQANPNKNANGVILEASLDKGRGYVAKMLVQSGTLNIGDPIVAGEHAGKVKAMFNERNKRVKKAGPSTPVLVLGLSGAPQAGERFKVLENEQETKNLANKRAQLNREQQQRATRRLTLDDLGRRIKLGNFQQLNLIIKGDVDGSIEALSDSLLKQSIENIQINIVHRAVGQITESDVLLAAASDAIIIGFQVRPSVSARRLGEQEGVDVRLYSVIYDAIDEIRAAMEGMLEAKQEKEVTAQIEVRDVFKISKVGTIAGCYVTEGKANRSNFVTIIRNGIVVYPTKEGQQAELESLKRFKDDVKEIGAGYECGVKIKNFNDVKVGDIFETYEIIEVKQTLADFEKIANIEKREKKVEKKVEDK